MALLLSSLLLPSPIATKIAISSTSAPSRRRHSRLASCCIGTSSSSPISSSAGNPFVDHNDKKQFGDARRSESATTSILNTAESTIEKVIFDFRFLALLAIGGSLAGSVLCFLNGCIYIFEAYKVYWTGCLKGVHTGQMVLRLVEAIDVYLAGTVMLIFGMGLYELFISNMSQGDGTKGSVDRALRSSSLFGMFSLKERPAWMKISSLDELKTKVGHVIVMILLVKMFERSKCVQITSGMDLLSYSVCIFLSSASLYILHNLHKSDTDIHN